MKRSIVKDREKLKRIIESCTKPEHFAVALNCMKMYQYHHQDSETTIEMAILLDQRKQELFIS